MNTLKRSYLAKKNSFTSYLLMAFYAEIRPFLQLQRGSASADYHTTHTKTRKKLMNPRRKGGQINLDYPIKIADRNLLLLFRSFQKEG